MLFKMALITPSINSCSFLVISELIIFWNELTRHQFLRKMRLPLQKKFASPKKHIFHSEKHMIIKSNSHTNEVYYGKFDNHFGRCRKTPCPCGKFKNKISDLCALPKLWFFQHYFFRNQELKTDCFRSMHKQCRLKHSIFKKNMSATQNFIALLVL